MKENLLTQHIVSKAQLRALIREQGGIHSAQVNETCTHLVVSDKDLQSVKPKGE